MKKTRKGKYQNKQVYLNAALSIIKEHGYEKLTMRQVAQHLNVSPMAIYKHFANKDELLKAVLDEFIARADVLPEQALNWQDWLEYVALKMYGALRTNINWLPLLGSFEVGENALKITFAVIQRLQDAGFSNEQAMQAYLSMIHLILGAVSIQVALEKGGNNITYSADQETSFAQAPFREAIGRQQIEHSLPVLLAGLQQMLNAKV